ncbi:MAG TPA: acyltransferase, partial [Anaeromyxobacteraceae bacterium]|nr:acyltransferase [Anaeromyxobacteraceae bacterium]
RSWTPRRWLPELESLRGVAAFAVVLHHATLDSFGSRGGPFVALAAWLGGWGVAFFFVLSGFCIHLPRAREIARGERPSLGVLSFWRQRARRLLPTHYAALLLSCLVAEHFRSRLLTPPTASTFLQHVFMVHVFGPAFYSINAVFWSIAVEVHFYLLYPLFLKMRERMRAGVQTLLLLALGLATYASGSLLFPAGSTGRLVVHTLFLVSWWQWSLGALLAEAYARGADRMAQLFAFRGALPLWLTCSLGLAFVDPVLAGFHLRQWLLPPLCALVLAQAITFGAGSWSAHRGLRAVGTFSYSLYLVHPVAQAALRGLVRPSLGMVSVAASCAISLLAAWLFFVLFERPFLKKPAHARHAPDDSRHAARVQPLSDGLSL